MPIPSTIQFSNLISSKCVTVLIHIPLGHILGLSFPAGMEVAIYEENIGFEGAPTLTCVCGVVANYRGDDRRCCQSQPIPHWIVFLIEFELFGYLAQPWETEWLSCAHELRKFRHESSISYDSLIGEGVSGFECTYIHPNNVALHSRVQLHPHPTYRPLNYHSRNATRVAHKVSPLNPRFLPFVWTHYWASQVDQAQVVSFRPAVLDFSPKLLILNCCINQKHCGGMRSWRADR